MSSARVFELGQELTQSYEDLRRTVADGVAGERVDLKVMLSQGLWTWIEFVGSEKTRPSKGPRPASVSSPVSAVQPPTNRSDLVSAWADLLLGHLTALEAT